VIELNEEKRDKICRSLLKYDNDIVEIIQFGSSVYAPEYAKDVDLLVITKKRKEYGGYLDCSDELNLYFDVDVVVKEKNERLRGDFACQILGAFEILYGNARCLSEMTKNFDPSFEEAYAVLRKAKRDMDSVGELVGKEDREWSIRVAFNGLFHAARVAGMTYLVVCLSRLFSF
jgi:predicted nucleotidyltransferase